MSEIKAKINWKAVAAIIVSMAVMLAWALTHVTIDTDVLGSLPFGDPVIEDARYIFRHHPVQDQVVVDVSTEKENPDRLVQAADHITDELRRSGLFESVGNEDIQSAMPQVMAHVLDNLPVLFTGKELNDRIRPLLDREAVRTKLQGHMNSLMSLDGIGMAEFITRDPLGFSGVVFQKLSCLLPSQQAELYRGHVLSTDRKHLLLFAGLNGSATDSAVSQKLERLFNSLQNSLDGVRITPVGAYRASLDNERAARSDTKKAVLFATLGIVLLVIVSFPRPFMGLFALVPALFGTTAALFIFSLFHDSISVMAVGFGGALISITVDHGIAFMLFVDRPVNTMGVSAAHEVRSVGLLAALTSVGAFASLFLSGFSILAHIGLFAALGIACSFLFVHLFFARVFTFMPAAQRDGKTVHAFGLTGFLDSAVISARPAKAVVAVLFACAMAFFARPEFSMNLNDMNSVSTQTLEAEELLKETWGDIFNQVYLMLEGDSIETLRDIDSAVTEKMEDDRNRGVIDGSFTLSAIFPSPDSARENLRSWKRFWHGSRAALLERRMRACAVSTGFNSTAFEPFLRSLTKSEYRVPAIPDKLYPLLGISRKKDSPGLVSVVSVKPGREYHRQPFFERYSTGDITRVFDAKLFSGRLGQILSQTFVRMIMVIGISVILLLIIFYADLTLAVVSILPVLFALVATMGTLNITGHHFGIPDLMLSIVVIGMGVDYSLFMVRSAQRYGSLDHKLSTLVRRAVILASLSTLIGFGVLIFAEHSLLRSAGVTCFFGIGYSLLGSFMILPPVLAKIYNGQNNVSKRKKIAGAKDRIAQKVHERYRHLEAYPRMFARVKIGTDPLFREIDRYLDNIRSVFDIGTGYGIPLAWILSGRDDVAAYGIEPGYERARIADRVAGDRGWVRQGAAPDIPELPCRVDCVLMIDMMHYLNDDDLSETMRLVRDRLIPEGMLLARVTVPGRERAHWMRRVEMFRMRMHGHRYFYRSQAELKTVFEHNGFSITEMEPSGNNREELWMRARRRED